MAVRPLAGLRLAALVVLVVVLGAACSTGDDAVNRSGQFEFVAPEGKTEIHYQAQDRQRIGTISGPTVRADSATVGLSDFTNQVVVLNVWGSWCGPCRTEAPELEALHQQMQGSGGTVLGIDIRDDREAAADFLRNRDVTYPSIFDPPGKSLLALKGFPRSITPFTVVLDRQHRVAAIYLKPVLKSDVLPVVQRLSKP